MLLLFFLWLSKFSAKFIGRVEKMTPSFCMFFGVVTRSPKIAKFHFVPESKSPIKVKWPFEIFWTSVCLLIRVCSSESAILISWKKMFSQIQKIGSKLWFMKCRIYLNNEINISKFIPSNILSSSQNIWRKHSHWLIGTESICFFVRLLFRCLRPFSGFNLVKNSPL